MTRTGQTIRLWLDSARGALSRFSLFKNLPRDSFEAEAARLEKRGDYAGALACWQKKLNGGERASLQDIRRVNYASARLASLAHQWQQAIRFYRAVLAADPFDPRAKRGIELTAIRGAREAQIDGDWDAALTFWEACYALDAKSIGAQKGLERCLLTLARKAESDGYITRSRGYWTALFKVFPRDPRAVKGLQRTGGRVPAQ